MIFVLVDAIPLTENVFICMKICDFNLPDTKIIFNY